MSSNSNTCDRQISPVNHITFTDIMIFNSVMFTDVFCI